jgi:DNA-directed RNA polymerase subunit F
MLPKRYAYVDCTSFSLSSPNRLNLIEGIFSSIDTINISLLYYDDVLINSDYVPPPIYDKYKKHVVSENVSLNSLNSSLLYKPEIINSNIDFNSRDSFIESHNGELIYNSKKIFEHVNKLNEEDPDNLFCCINNLYAIGHINNKNNSDNTQPMVYVNWGNILPCPDYEESITKILDFKDKYIDLLNNFRIIQDEFREKVFNSEPEQIKHLVKSFKHNIYTNANNIANAMDAYKIRKRKGIFSIFGKLATAIINSKYKPLNSLVDCYDASLLIKTFLSGYKSINEPLKNNPFGYIHAQQLEGLTKNVPGVNGNWKKIDDIKY